ncbi:uncharacterized protein MONOS_6621 [Monocercomonoides exilis]|uniref:uncharacterized protein n=1 Tax=Monocercomonoides exilis TaxID=2049356 RepID=UPI00355980BB|nr:hypothetical protein MONOS_6621 [Monocercomonoides exilis]|eukprot:MONOS_6621.1-p1 / transcript=MONOS_6621.1 / gene=MONOS_6621 / organism=Monocercomonoides_exilis_PA203 / gene_product=unspecified product / transcript_product=unspecified product / location=Mono_scaffold00211:77130-78779(-) / protein_length=403 / sequence_SO=supercontig / SO=protein_coding / is_pseudo=false
MSCCVEGEAGRDSGREEREREKIGEKNKDSRNVYLLNEGVIVPGTPAAEGMTDYDWNLRRRLSESNRKKLLNPSTYVSSTRLSIHNLPFFMCGTVNPSSLASSSASASSSKKNTNKSSSLVSSPTLLKRLVVNAVLWGRQSRWEKEKQRWERNYGKALKQKEKEERMKMKRETKKKEEKEGKEEKEEKEGKDDEENKTSSSSSLTSALSVIPPCPPPPSTKVNIKQVVIVREKEDAPAQKGKYESSKRKRQSRLGKPKGYGVNCISVECSCFERGVGEREEAIQRQDRGGGEEGEGGVFERGEGEEEEGGGREEEGDDDDDDDDDIDDDEGEEGEEDDDCIGWGINWLIGEEDDDEGEERGRGGRQEEEEEDEDEETEAEAEEREGEERLLEAEKRFGLFIG